MPTRHEHSHAGVKALTPNEGTHFNEFTGEITHPRGAIVHPSETFQLAQGSYISDPYTSKLLNETFERGIYRKGVYAAPEFEALNHYLGSTGGIGAEGGEVLRIITGQPIESGKFLRRSENVITQPRVIHKLQGITKRDRYSQTPVGQLRLQSETRREQFIPSSIRGQIKEQLRTEPELARFQRPSHKRCRHTTIYPQRQRRTITIRVYNKRRPIRRPRHVLH